MFYAQRSLTPARPGRKIRTSFAVGSIIVPHSGVMSMLPGIICDYESRGLEEAGELAGLSDEGRVKAMHIAT